MRHEPQKIKLTNTPPSSKDVRKIPLPPINPNQYDIDMSDDIYIRPDNDSVYKPINDENTEQNNS